MASLVSDFDVAQRPKHDNAPKVGGLLCVHIHTHSLRASSW